MLGAWIKGIAKAVLPVKVRLWLRDKQRLLSARGKRSQMAKDLARLFSLPVIRHLRCLQFRRLQPFGVRNGRGRETDTSVVRYYWARFLEKNRSHVRGHALEIGTTKTIRHYGGQTLTQVDAIDVTAHGPEITVVADLSRADHIPSDTYDCFLNQFTMHIIYDLEAALYHSIRILKPGGVLLANFPCLSYYFPRGLNMGTGTVMQLYRWFTPIQVEDFLRHAGLTELDYKIEIFGNLFSRGAYQMNIPAEELTHRELESVDLWYPLLVCVRVVKPARWEAKKPEYRDCLVPNTNRTGIILLISDLLDFGGVCFQGLL